MRARARWIMIAVLIAAILIAVIIVATVRAGTFATVRNTDSPIVTPGATGAAVPFDKVGPISNITFTAPDTLVLGPNAEGTYTATISLNLKNTTGSAKLNQYFLQVNGVSTTDLFAAVGVGAGATNTCILTFRNVALPSGAAIKLLNVGSPSEFTNMVEGQTVPSVTLQLVRTGP